MGVFGKMARLDEMGVFSPMARLIPLGVLAVLAFSLIGRMVMLVSIPAPVENLASGFLIIQQPLQPHRILPPIQMALNGLTDDAGFGSGLLLGLILKLVICGRADLR